MDPRVEPEGDAGAVGASAQSVSVMAVAVLLGPGSLPGKTGRASGGRGGGCSA
jgi:hypothetical protein